MKKKLRRLAATLYKVWTLHFLYPRRYGKLVRERSADPRKVVLLEVRMETLSDSFTEVEKALDQSGAWNVRRVFLTQDMADRRTVRRRSLAALEELADAAWIFVNDSSYLLGALKLRPETRVIQLWHACGAFKRFGYSLKGKRFGSQKKDLDRFPLYRNFSYVTVSSPEVRWAYQEAFSLPLERIVPTGVARTDLFFDPLRKQQAMAQLKALLPECFSGGRARRIVLYAPTFRGRVADAVSPEALDFSLLRELLSEDYLFLCKHHPFVKKRPALPEELSDFVRDLTDEMPIESLLMVSDICISDYSSLIFEYSLLERPMLFFAPDLADYDDWRGFYYSYEEMTPGPVVSTTRELAGALKTLEGGFDPKAVRAFRERFMGSCDGNATKRILSLMTE